MKRYEIERAVGRAQLPGPSKSIMRALLARINAKTGTIPGEHQPSLSQLASLSGYDRSTVMKHLNALEKAGWVIRIRPPMWLARTQHVTTAYAMRIPDGYPQARRRGEPRHAADREQARRAAAQALAARDSEADRAAADPLDAGPGGPDRTAAPVTDMPTEEVLTDQGQESSPAGIDDDPQLRASLAKTAIEEMRELTGRTLTLTQATGVVRLVLGGRRVKHHDAYLRKTLRTDPQRYLPAKGSDRGLTADTYSDLARAQREAIEKSEALERAKQGEK